MNKCHVLYMNYPLNNSFLAPPYNINKIYVRQDESFALISINICYEIDLIQMFQTIC